ncbi:hypothetical protein TraAM80_05423 [Trypanosoma rangeli]|uniref:Paraquat-inducible protein A n=1 Tax=Trypanosoma rangeli TaxID=5698 RepID=A0A422NF17_TRYRA|nr:uncharacterized protein TraAM80_05423 [Trypanosoma rangeli]RNF04071.1 hypothetical protein TraAM80_05423 [Trypanosoma rangeli]|eukprot:RNF04071.1 hypothetical protein TraAM80_05423 [Trypanosoma rangeli]
MSAGCLSLLLLWSSFIINVPLPKFSYDTDVFGVPTTVSNISCSEIRVAATSITSNSNSFSVVAPDLYSVKCGFDLDGVDARILIGVQIQPLEIEVRKSVDDTCYSTGATLNKCIANFTLTSFETQPPSPLTDLLEFFKQTVEEKLSGAICNTVLPNFVNGLKNRTIDPPTPPPPLVEGATPLESLPLVRAVVRAANKLPPFSDMQVDASLHASTTLRLGLTFLRGVHLKLDSSVALEKYFVEVMNLYPLRDIPELSNLVKHMPVIEKEFFGLNIPQTFSVSVELVVNDLRCNKDGLKCSVPISNGIQIQNFRVKNLAEYDHILMDSVGLLLQFLNTKIGEMLRHGVVSGSRVIIPDIKKSDSEGTPSVGLLVGMVVVGVILIVATVPLSIWRYRRNVVTTREGDPISLKRVLLEDVALMFMTVLAAFGFTWSNATPAASLVLGEEFPLMSFSLMESTKNMYHAGVYVFAVLVFLFSGVYPYIKLVVIVICTLFLQQPDLLILKLIEYFGKFSFLDSCAMILMISGLQLHSVVSVEVHAGFYFFLAATTLSIFIGNYATTIWRRHTSLRKNATPKGAITYDGAEAQNNVSEEDKQNNWWAMFWGKDGILRLVNTAFVTICVILCWVVPCIRYTVNGMASIIMPEDRLMTLWEISLTNKFFLCICIFVVLIAPILYAFMYPRWYMLASWSAADAFLLACVAGLVQMEQFLRYLLGNEMKGIYGASATLLWPLIPLLIAAVWQWMQAADNTFKVIWHVKGWLAARKVAQPPQPSQPL